MSKFRFFDDPIVKLGNWFLQQEQTWMRGIIAKKYSGVLDPQVYWIVGTDKEKEGLSTDPVEQTVQRISLSQVGVFMAQRIWSRRTWIILPILTAIGMAISYILLNKSGTTSSPTLIPLTVAVTIWLAVMLIFAATLFAPIVAQFFMPRTPVRQDEIDAVHSVMAKCMVRDHAPDTPPDLADRPRVLVADAEGRSVAGQVLATDLEYSAVRAEWANTKAVMFTVGLAMLSPALAVAATWAAVLLYYAVVWTHTDNPMTPKEPQQEQAGSGLVWGLFKWIVMPMILAAVLGSGTPKYLDSIVPAGVTVAQWGFVLLVWALVLWRATSIPSPLAVRAMLLEQSVRESGSELLIDKAGRTHFAMLEQARLEQVKNARKDASLFIPLGTSTGLLAQRRDPLAPTEAGLPVGVSVEDLSTHLLVLGASGTGKTSGVIRPLTKTWLNHDLGGLLVLDGKGALPLELNGLHAGYRLISPAHGPFNPIAGMSPDAVADVLTDVLDDGNGGDNKFFSDSARLMLRMAAIILQAHPKLPYTLGELQRFCMLPTPARLQELEPLSDKIDANPRIAAAANYWFNELPTMPEKTSGSIVNMVRTWLGNISLHAELGPWTDTVASDAAIEDAMQGAKLGLLLPESRYSVGGVAISALCMRRLYDAVKARGDNWRSLEGHKPVLLAADEVQNLLTKADLETVPVARSLGLSLLFATQNVDGLYKRLDKDGAVQMLGNLASMIALPPRTDDSNKYVTQRSGQIWKATTYTYHGLPDAAADLGIYSNSGVDRNMQEVMLHRQSRIGAPRLSFAIGLWHRAWQPKPMAWLHELVVPDDTGSNQPLAKPTLQLALAPLVTPEELDTLLALPGTALAVLNRGRVQRRDVIRLGGVA